MAARPVLALVSLLLLAGGIVMQFLVILSGAVRGSPENQIYFLQSTTRGIPNARNPTRWAFFALTGVDDNRLNSNYGSTVPALPFDPPRNFGTQSGIPTSFLGTHYYYYLSRFMFAFYLIALFFAVIAFLTGLLALCTRLGAYLSSLNTALAFFFQALAASLMTAWTVKGRNRFRSAGQDSHLGVKAHAFTWAAFACFFLATITFCLGGSSGRREKRNKNGLGRKGSRRSRNSARGSFTGSERAGVKEEYV
ncbi:SUR7-domain-containing protein [Venturia nashicola]|uniref:SUR7-domain-containing protein n=1 Tax=Venturia nashicola TaxID=86259 RepID=A0A4Z1P6W3_9PEZI|nr:SUR7-domain-containing protein [Venturia nashicola]TLD25710.1 SUR7-domain-containing protein [Venturia nashicola]